MRKNFLKREKGNEEAVMKERNSHEDNIFQGMERLKRATP